MPPELPGAGPDSPGGNWWIPGLPGGVAPSAPSTTPLYDGWVDEDGNTWFLEPVYYSVLEPSGADALAPKDDEADLDADAEVRRVNPQTGDHSGSATIGLLLGGMILAAGAFFSGKGKERF